MFSRWIQEVDVVRFPHTILEHCRSLPHLCEWVFTTDVISKLQVFRVLSPKLKVILISNLSILRVHGEGYSRSANI